MAEGYVAIRLALLGVSAFVAESRAAAGGLSGIGAAAAAANTKSAAMAAGLNRASRRMQSVGRRLTTHVTAPLLGIGVVAGKMSLDFGRNMELIHTQAGARQQDIAGLSKQVLDMGRNTVQGPNELAKGLFHLKSIGMDNVDAMKALKASADAAEVGNANLEQTTTALGGAWLVGIKGAGSFDHTLGVMNATIGAGNMRMDDLVNALGTGLLPMAKLAGLRIQDVGGALALLTDEGWTASHAATTLGTSFHYLYRPTKKAGDALAVIGLGQFELSKDMEKPRGLLTALTKLRDGLESLPGGIHGAQAKSVLGDIFPASRGKPLLAIINQLDRYKVKIDQIERTTKNYGEAVKHSHELPINRLRRAWARMQVLLIRLGNDIIPLVVPVLEKLAGGVERLTKGFSRQPKWLQKTELGFLAVMLVAGPLLFLLSPLPVLLGLVASGFGLVGAATGALGIELAVVDGGLAVAIGGMTVFAAVSTIVAGALALLTIGGLIYAYVHFEKFRKVVNFVGKSLLLVMGPIGWTALALIHFKDKIVGAGKKVLNFTTDLLGMKNKMILAKVTAFTTAEGIRQAFSKNPVSEGFSKGISDIATNLSDLLTTSNSLLGLQPIGSTPIPDILGNPSTPSTPGSSTINSPAVKPKTPAKKKTKSKVAGQAAMYRPSLVKAVTGVGATWVVPQAGEQTTIIPVNIDGKQVTKVVHKRTADRMARRKGKP